MPIAKKKGGFAPMTQSVATHVALDGEQVVVFDVFNESYAVNIARVHEIIRLQQITVIPGAPPYIEGVINLRGKVIPVLDLRKRFGLQADEHTRSSRIV